ncbi:MAG: peptidase [Chlorobi bacterium]|nr:peptidase [Chlorobiota bacterium]
MSYNIDIHCHPTLKISLFNRTFWERHGTISGWDPFEMQVDLPKMAEGNLKAILSAVYLPERGLLEFCPVLRDTYPMIRFFWNGIDGRIEKNSYPSQPFDQTMAVINLFEANIQKARGKGFDVAVARSNGELNERLTAGKTTVLHTVEGGHSLGRGLASVDDYIVNLHKLFKAGVCALTLGHFFPNDLVSPVMGLPPSMVQMIGCTFKPDLGALLRPAGEAVVRRMLEIGMIVDLTHCTPATRNQIYGINHGKRPLVISHVGVSGIFNAPMNASDADIDAIKACNGVIGIILLNYWLSGHDDKLLGFQPGLDSVVRSIQYIRQRTGTYDNIAIGSDFDGFTDPADDLQDSSKFIALRHRLESSGISAADVDNIMRGNILRVLRNGWGL